MTEITNTYERIRGAPHRLLWVGVAMVVLGVVALVFPMFSTLVATLMVGWMLLFFGGITFFSSFSIHGTGPFFGALLLGVASIAAGVFLLFNPLSGAVALTLVVAIIFSLQGALEISFAFELRPVPAWKSMLLSGLISVALAIVIAAGWPSISNIVLGTLFGVNFISTGVGYIFLSRALTPHAR